MKPPRSKKASPFAKAAAFSMAERKSKGIQPEMMVTERDATMTPKPVEPMEDVKPVLPEERVRERYKLIDNRQTDLVTGKPVPDTSRLNYNIDLETAKAVIRAAKMKGANPYTALAITVQETGGGTIGGDFDDPLENPMRVHQALHGEILDDGVSKGIDVMMSKFEMAKKMGKKNEYEVIQAYNGYGKVGKRTEGKQNFMYGIDVSKEPIDMSKNPVYGKRIVDIRDNILMKDPNIVKLVQETK